MTVYFPLLYPVVSKKAAHTILTCQLLEEKLLYLNIKPTLQL